MPLSQAQQTWRDGGDIDYLHVTARGRLHHDKERYLFAQSLADGTPGWHVITPLETAGGDMVLVDRGFVVYLGASKRAHIVELERELELTKLDRDWFKREDAEARLVRGPATP